MDDSIDEPESEAAVSGEAVKIGSELPVPIDTLLLDGIRPEMGDRVTVEVAGTISSIRDDCAYVKLETANDQPIKPAKDHGDETSEADDANERGAGSSTLPMTIVYRQRGNQVEKILIPGRSGIRARGVDHFRHNSERVLRGYYELECEQKFKSNYPKSVIKRVHQTAMARAEAGMDSRLKKDNNHE